MEINDEEDDYTCPYEQTQATNYFNQQQTNNLDDDVLSDIFSDEGCETEAGSPPVRDSSHNQLYDQKFLGG